MCFIHKRRLFVGLFRRRFLWWSTPCLLWRRGFTSLSSHSHLWSVRFSRGFSFKEESHYQPMLSESKTSDSGIKMIFGRWPEVIACEQALRGALAAGREKEESLQLCLWNLKICIEKLDAKCWLAEMTLVMTSFPLRCAFTCFSMLVYIRARLVMRIEDMITQDEFAW